ncbi:glycosyltransferase [Arthrobacter sp. NPDC080073]|uniref:glycosyltransferase n=1 Tax=Arthrobacter sp. NPDC080073 TaxID=3155919 RepID=UPI0034232189
MTPELDVSTRLASVAGVVTAFHPTPHLVENVASLLKQLSTVVVVDDGSGEGFDHIFGAVAEAGAVVLTLESNSGIAAALNAGIARARSSAGIEHIVTVDQDSLLPDDYVQKLLSASASARSAGVQPGLVSPARIHGNPVKRAGTRRGVVLGREPIQSGLLIPTSTLDIIGNFWDGLFIDLVDTEYYFRALDAGLPTVLADTEFDHSLGTMVDAKVFGRTVRVGGRNLQVRIAATWRYYYIFRNRILVGARYVRRHPVWVVVGVLTDLRHLAFVTVLAPGRTARLASAISGIVDGVRGDCGRKHQ